MSEHPSYFVLDSLRLGRVPAGEPALAQHLGACERCAAYLRQEVSPPLAPPPWLAGVTLAPAGALPAGPAAGRRWWTRPLLLWPSFSLLALAGVLLLVRGGALDGADDRAGTREKGAPALGVFVKRGDHVFPWDGRAQVRADDRLRFEVHPSGYRFVSVASRAGNGAAPAVLYAGELQPGLRFLPISFRVDDQGRQEVVSVILGHRPIPVRLHAEASEPPSSDETWRQIFVFDKTLPDARP